VKVRARGGSGLKRWTSACSPGKRGAARVSARSSHCRSLVDNDQNRGAEEGYATCRRVLKDKQTKVVVALTGLILSHGAGAPGSLDLQLWTPPK